ncbi:multicopper oxidase family protein [Williamsia sp. MIQD14]|uniref:multicopper oxidase family protein n=1 Tax=Williamsia sp. MIQD14 TaxID=3425703 RepID=UPI003DA172FE
MSHEINRRKLLRTTAAIGGLAAVGGLAPRAAARPDYPPAYPFPVPTIFHSPPLAKFVDEMIRPPVRSGVGELSITARSGRARMHRDLPSVPSFGYSDMPYLGATIDGRVGEPTTFRYRNELLRHPFAADIDTTLHGVSESYRDRPPNSLHLHGAVTAPDSDGNPERLLLPRVGTAVHHYPNRQEAGHLWYHDHAMGITRSNVYAGLAGNFLLRDDHDTGDASNRVGLPYGDHEIPLILQEKIFTAAGHMSIRSTPVVPQGRWEGGAVGDVGMINGTVWPKITVDRGLYRFRILNAGSYSVWTLHLSDATPMWVIGNEGGLLDAPVEVRSFRIAPGERYDVLVDFSRLRPGDTVDLCNSEDPPLQAAMLGEVRMPVFGRFVASARSGFRGPVPSRLRGRPGLPDALPPIARAGSVRNVTVSQPYALRLPPAIMSLNNLRYSDPQLEMPRQGTTEIWNIINITPDPHPIHIHLVTFRILGRRPLRTVEYQAAHPQPAIGVRWAPAPDRFYGGRSRGPAPWEAGWKDTVRTDGGTVTQVVVRFPTAEELGFDPDATFPADPLAGTLDTTGSRAPSAPPATTETPSAPSAPTRDDPAATHPAPDHSMHDGMHHAAGPHMHPTTLQGYVWHCHILDHEDHDMMLRYRVRA